MRNTIPHGYMFRIEVKLRELLAYCGPTPGAPLTVTEELTARAYLLNLNLNLENEP
jgi:hypothetical protein